MPIQRSVRILAGVAAILVCSISPAPLAASAYYQTNLVSNVPGLGALTDPNLVNPWGVASSPTGPFWISDNGTNLTTLYTGAPAVVPLVVSVPGGPTGQVFNSNANAFILSNNKAANFIFDTQAGTISGWNGAIGSTAMTEYSNPTGSYTGLAIGASGPNTYLYAANAAGSVDVFNSSFAPVSLAGHFTDPNLPAGYVPYNVQLIGTQLFVTYVKYDSKGAETPSGIVDVYNTDGTFASRFSSSALLDAPWGITLAPSTFGDLGGDLLIGNFLNGEINGFDPITGSYLGTLNGTNGQPIADPGLWALDFRTGGAGNNTNALYFTAGIHGEADGLFGEIATTPEPAPLLLAGTGILALALALRRHPKTLTTP